MLSEHRDRYAARRFLWQLAHAAGGKPLRVTTHEQPASRGPIRGILGRKVLHRTTRTSTTNRAEPSGREAALLPMLGFGSFESASRFCATLDELRQLCSAINGSAFCLT